MSVFLQFIFITVAIFLVITMYMTWTVEKTMQASYWLILFLVGISILFLINRNYVAFQYLFTGGISLYCSLHYLLNMMIIYL